MIYSLIDILIPLFDSIFMLKLFKALNPTMNEGKKLIEMALISILYIELWLVSEVFAKNVLMNFLPFITLLSYTITIAKVKFTRAIVSIGVVFISFLILNSIFILFGSLFNSSAYNFIYSDESFVYMLTVASKFFVILEYMYLTNYYKREIPLSAETWKSILLILLLSISIIAFSVNEFVSYGLSKYYVLSIIATFVVVNTMIFRLCIQTSKQAIENANNELFIQSIAYETKLLDIIKEKTEELSKVNHDFKHHIAVLQQMLENNTDTAKQYLNSITLPKSMEYIHTENVVLNYILNDKISLAKSKNINVRRSVIGNTSDFYINNIDISIILGNLLDNAIEACALVCENPFIDIEIIVDQYKTVITIKNSTILDNKETNEKLMTTKLDKKHHGYGMKNIETVVNKYQGEDFYSVKNHVFTHICIVNNIEE